MPQKSECEEQIRQKTSKLVKLLENKMQYEKLKYEHLRKNRFFLHPEILYERRREELDALAESCRVSAQKAAEDRTSILRLILQRLDGVSPLKILQRGYGVLEDAESLSTIRSVGDTHAGAKITAKLFDGQLSCTVTDVRKSGGSADV